jgi:hypothetical protein
MPSLDAYHVTAGYHRNLTSVEALGEEALRLYATRHGLKLPA